MVAPTVSMIRVLLFDEGVKSDTLAPVALLIKGSE